MEQIERTKRYLERMRKIYSGVEYIKDKQYYIDDVFSFFVHCHHIKDWIIQLHNSGTETSRKKAVKIFINQHYELKICADLCNGTKHCNLKNQLTDNQPCIAGRCFTSSNDEITKGKFTILSNEKCYDALELAEECMKLWESYLENLNVLSGKTQINQKNKQ